MFSKNEEFTFLKTENEELSIIVTLIFKGKLCLGATVYLEDDREIELVNLKHYIASFDTKNIVSDEDMRDVKVGFDSDELIFIDTYSDEKKDRVQLIFQDDIIIGANLFIEDVHDDFLINHIFFMTSLFASYEEQKKKE